MFGIVFIANERFARFFSGLLFFLKSFEARLKRAYAAVSKYRRHRALMLKSFAISVISQALFFLSLGLLVLSIGARFSPIEIFLRAPIICTMSLLPSINGLGLREGATVVFFGPLIGRENAFAVSILWLAVLFITSVIGALIYAISPQFRMRLREIEKIEEEEVLI
jgi:uncharacterized protein (TIRG00374 family)